MTVIGTTLNPGTTPTTGVYHKPPAAPTPPRTHTWLIASALLAVVALLPLSDALLGPKLAFAGQLPQIFVYALLSLGLTVITGFTGLLHLGVIAFMAIGVYVYAIATCPIYPFQIGFWPGLALATVGGAGAGFLLGLPTMRLRGDYLAIVTLGFGEIVQDCLKNLEVVTKGTMGINPLPPPTLPWFGDLLGGAHTYRPTYYLYLALLILAIAMVRNLKRARIGRAWLAVREDELAARAMGIGVAKQKLAAFSVAAALCAAAGALFAALRGTSIEPGYYDFQNSVMVVASVIIGGLGSISGALLGALLIFGFNLIVLGKIADALGHHASTNVMADPKNWKCLIFGVILVLMMRFRPQGLLPAREAR